MRTRKKKWTDSELAQSKIIKFYDDAVTQKGKWHDFFETTDDIFLEIGCGKGRFSCEMSKKGKFMIALERDSKVIACASRLARTSYDSPQNLIFVNAEAEKISEIFAEHELSGIFMNFSDPWEGGKKLEKKRLTHNGFLENYSKILRPGGILSFRTDNAALFEFSIKQLKESRFEIIRISEDFHSEPYFGETPMTEYEIKFAALGNKIHYVECKMKALG
ncbi:MAG: tRNA (guanosine(46)-N7)-methyltransferase TrmB [Clostridiales bacterium]|jgi:tRNA (guanine-N7-)-methyltransferase|nr:tRNA (guanosine(46)-N7)-methyltransferase TrmB [Clostridiales bacterium]